jgi:hypothetical protein
MKECHTIRMPSRASRGGKRANPTQNALRIVEEATGDVLKPAEGKNVHAQALSALGASKGGKARAAKLSKQRRKAIAKQAAAKRWAKKPSS